jgi:hypothetical protein
MMIGFAGSSFPSWKQESFFMMRLILQMKGIVCVRINEGADNERL